MGPSVLQKTKAQERERVRKNQQRSRERKRAYIGELEAKIRQLGERLQCGDDELAAAIERLMVENEAQRQLLRAMGVNNVSEQHSMPAAAQPEAQLQAPDVLDLDWSVDAFSADLNSLPLPPMIQSQSQSRAPYASDPAAVAGAARLPLVDTGRIEAVTDSSDQAAAASLASLSDESRVPLSTRRQPTDPEIKAQCDTANPSCAPCLPSTTPSLATGTLAAGTKEPRPDPGLESCLQDTVIHINATPSDGTTPCSVAFSMIFQHNVRGYTTAELEKRLKTGFRKALVPAEGCRVVNKVLFQLLAEIS